YPPLVKAITEQAGKFNHVCNYYQSDTSLLFAEKLVQSCAPAGIKKIFLANSGAEANEGACKLARKYSLLKYGEGRHTIVTLKGSFHGRTITTLSATGQEKFHKDFGPFTSGFVHIEAGDIEVLDKALDSKTVAGFLVEVIQGESGIVCQKPEYLAAAAKFCEERDILLIFDEIQCGMGRTGTFLGLEQYKDSSGNPLQADIITLAKGLAGGIPAGALLAGEKTKDVFTIGDHGSTFGGNPIAAAAGLVVLENVNTPEFLQEIKRKGEKIMAALRKNPKVKKVRGMGLMIGFDIEETAFPILEKAVARAQKNEFGLLMLAAGTNTLRLLPPYTLTDEEITQGLEIIEEIL
ncbi:MAG: aminotransferase class III-fold pyridoxal phosphate-dependent enzyme, partial [Treponema sp.]|nr:aminotransferase class III-fold pyridoxal phosphate-dependent enzyme [Treponema sp.]